MLVPRTPVKASELIAHLREPHPDHLRRSIMPADMMAKWSLLDLVTEHCHAHGISVSEMHQAGWSDPHLYLEAERAIAQDESWTAQRDAS